MRKPLRQRRLRLARQPPVQLTQRGQLDRSCHADVKLHGKNAIVSLASMLKQLFQNSMTARSQAAYSDLVLRLRTAETAVHAVKVGDEAPSFLLPNAEGQLIASEDLLAAGPLVVTFFRGGWCPYCDLAMRAMEEALQDIQAAGAGFVAIWPETGGLALRVKRERSLTYELLVDVDHSVAMQFGIVFRMPDLYREMLIDEGTDLAKRQGNPSWLVPMTATYVIAPNGVVLYAFVDGDFTLRAEPAEVIAFLKTLKL